MPRRLAGRCRGLQQPLEVGFAGGFRSEDDELGNLVGVQAADGLFEAGEVRSCGFDEEQKFGRSFDLALPAVDGREAGNDADAGGELLVDEGSGDALGFFARAGGGQDQAGFGGGYNHRCVRERTGKSLAES